MALVRLTCIIQSCKQPFATRGSSPYCPNCRRNIGGWSERPAADIIRYFGQLRIRSERLSTLAAGSKGNVITFRRDLARIRRNG